MQHKQVERNWDELKKLGYEPENIKLKALTWSGIFFFVFVAANLLGAAYFLRYLNPAAFTAPGPKAAFANRAPQPPNPLLQTNITTKTDIKELRQNERAVLESYGNVDGGHLRVPIDRAIELSLEKNLIPGKPSTSVIVHGSK